MIGYPMSIDSMWTGTVIKETMESSVGISFRGRGTASSPVIIAGVSGLFAEQTSLVPGLKVESINGVSVEGMNSEWAAMLVREAGAGILTIEASGVVARATKVNVTDPVGISFQKVGNSIVIAGVTDTGLMASKGLQFGHKVTYINNLPCPKRTPDAVKLIRFSKEISIVCIDADLAADWEDPPLYENAVVVTAPFFTAVPKSSSLLSQSDNETITTEASSLNNHELDNRYSFPEEDSESINHSKNYIIIQTALQNEVYEPVSPQMEEVTEDNEEELPSQ